MDNPLPSGNALAAEALLTLASYTGEEKWRQSAERALLSSSALVDRYPSMVGHHLSVLHALGTSRELAVVGPEPVPFAEVFW